MTLNNAPRFASVDTRSKAGDDHSVRSPLGPEGSRPPEGVPGGAANVLRAITGAVAQNASVPAPGCREHPPRGGRMGEVAAPPVPVIVCVTCSFRRRALLLFLVALTLYLTGCATYELRQAPQSYGTATVSWAFGQTFPDGRCGEAIKLAGNSYILRFAGNPPSFNDTARLICIGHEWLHAFGGSHQ